MSARLPTIAKYAKRFGATARLTEEGNIRIEGRGWLIHTSEVFHEQTERILLDRIRDAAHRSLGAMA